MIDQLSASVSGLKRQEAYRRLAEDSRSGHCQTLTVLLVGKVKRSADAAQSMAARYFIAFAESQGTLRSPLADVRDSFFQ